MPMPMPKTNRVRHTASDPSSLCTSAAQGKRVKVVGLSSLGSQYVNQTGVVTGCFGNAGPREVAVKLDNGRTEFFARRYLQMLTPQTSPPTHPNKSPTTILQLCQERAGNQKGRQQIATLQRDMNDIRANRPHQRRPLGQDAVLPLPEGWMVLKPGHARYDNAEGGRIYYYQKATSSVQYEHPAKGILRETIQKAQQQREEQERMQRVAMGAAANAGYGAPTTTAGASGL